MMVKMSENGKEDVQCERYAPVSPLGKTIVITQKVLGKPRSLSIV
jgi:hypothetical protein